MSDEQKARDYLTQRRLAYKRVFDPENQDVKFVLEDLARFCRAHESTFDPDQRVHALLEGRKEVWNRLQHHLQMTDQDIWHYYTRKG
jgi:hypothetical protein